GTGCLPALLVAAATRTRDGGTLAACRTAATRQGARGLGLPGFAAATAVAVGVDLRRICAARKPAFHVGRGWGAPWFARRSGCGDGRNGDAGLHELQRTPSPAHTSQGREGSGRSRAPLHIAAVFPPSRCAARAGRVG